jgi:hypothetical protein
MVKTGLARAHKEEQEKDSDVDRLRPIIKPAPKESAVLSCRNISL